MTNLQTQQRTNKIILYLWCFIWFSFSFSFLSVFVSGYTTYLFSSGDHIDKQMELIIADEIGIRGEKEKIKIALKNKQNKSFIVVPSDNDVAVSVRTQGRFDSVSAR